MVRGVLQFEFRGVKGEKESAIETVSIDLEGEEDRLMVSSFAFFFFLSSVKGICLDGAKCKQRKQWGDRARPNGGRSSLRCRDIT